MFLNYFSKVRKTSTLARMIRSFCTLRRSCRDRRARRRRMIGAQCPRRERRVIFVAPPHAVHPTSFRVPKARAQWVAAAGVSVPVHRARVHWRRRP